MNTVIFTSNPDTLCDSDTMLVEVPSGITTKSELLDWFGRILMFPNYYGANWDAFDECLRDLSWVKQKKIVLFHHAIPLDGNTAEQKTYLELLACVVRDWESDPLHELLISFDPACEPKLKGINAGV